MNIHEVQSSPSDRIEHTLPGISPVINIAVLRCHHSVIAIILIHLFTLQRRPLFSAEGQEMPRRHSLIHHSAVHSALASATTHGTILQSSSDQPTRITTPIEPPIAAIVPPAIELSHRRTSAKPPAIASIPPVSNTSCHLDIRHCGRTGHTDDNRRRGKHHFYDTAAHRNTDCGTSCWNGFNELCCGHPDHSLSVGQNRRCSLHGLSRRRQSLHWQLTIDIEPVQKLCHRELVATTDTCDHHTPSPPPRSTPSSTSPPPNGSTGNVRLTWRGNQEPDLAGYKLYIGTASGIYNFSGSPFSIDNATSYIASNLPKGQTYFFALSALDTAGNESVLSAEISKSLY